MKIMYDVVDLAREIDKTNPIDWGMLSVDEDSAYRVIASQIIEKNFETPEEYRNIMLMATATHLVIENMVLNAKLLAMLKEQDGKPTP